LGSNGTLLEAVDHVGDTGSFDAVTTGGELIVVVLEFGVEQFDLVEDETTLADATPLFCVIR
jgi:hypothetical protein